MIENETAYRLTSEAVLQREARLIEHRSRLKIPGLTEVEIRRVIQPIETFQLQLREELEDFETRAREGGTERQQ